MVGKKGKWLLYVAGACLATSMVGATAAWTEVEPITVDAAAAVQDISDLAISNGAIGAAGSNTAFNFRTPQSVTSKENRIHVDKNYGQWNTSVTDFDISFQMEFGDWGDNGWFGFESSGKNQIRIYNDKVETQCLIANNRLASKSFATEITSGWHSVRMILDDGKDGCTGQHTTFNVKVIIDGVETSYQWFTEDWQGNVFFMRNETGTTVNMLSSKSPAPKDISELAISNNEIGSVGGETAFNFNEVQSVATGAHRIHTDKNYGSWDTATLDFDISFKMEFGDWGDDGWFGFNTAGPVYIRVFNHKMTASFLYNGSFIRDYTADFATEITSGWHTVRIVYNNGQDTYTNSHSYAWTAIVEIDGVATKIVSNGQAMEDWSGNAVCMHNQTGAPVNVLSSKVEAPSAQKAINALVNNAYMTAGASIRLNANGNGIRFETNVLAKDVEELKAWMANGAIKAVSFGTMIVPTDYLTEGETLETLRVAGKVADCVSTGFYEKVSDETTYRFWGSLVDIQAFNYTRSFIGVGYICVTDSEDNATYYYVEYDLSNARSMYSVAKAAYTSDYAWTEAEKTALKAYIDGVVIINTNGQYMGGLDEAVYTPAYSVSYEDGVVTISSTSEIKTVVVYMSETQIVRLTSAQLTFSNENKTVSFAYSA